MFQQFILSGEESRRPWTFSVSLLAQALFIAIAVLIPLLAKPMLPVLNAAIVSLQLPKAPRAAAPPPTQQIVVVRPEAFNDALRQPRQMPDRAAILVEAEAPAFAVGPSIPGAEEGGVENGVISGLIRSTPVAPPQPPAPAAKPAPPVGPIAVSSGVQAAKIIKRVVPVYPPLARTAGISGVVRLQAIIAADGSIAELNVISGHPMLIAAAVNAVKQWQYRPTVLSGKPVPVNTQIDVNFTLGS